ncbi:MAG: hypothetical protein L3J86_03270, partial [Thermoplasmata archaeon]|nr:hypothetical protein [Thermoplasmata archaeon]
MVRKLSARIPLLLLVAVAVLGIPSAGAATVSHSRVAPHAGTPAVFALDIAGPRSALTYREPGLALPGATPTGRASTSLLSVFLSVPFSNSTALAALLAGLTDPASAGYRQYVTATGFDREFGSSPSAYAQLDAYLREFGVSNLQTYADRGSLTFQAPAGVVGRVFQTTIANYHDAARRGFYAPTRTPTLPSSLVEPGLYVAGLSSYSQYLIHAGAPGDRYRVATGTPAVPSSARAGGFLSPVTVGGVQWQYAPDYQVAYDEQSLFSEYGYPTNAVIATILWTGNYTGTPTTTPYGSLTTDQGVGPFVPSDISDFYNETLPAGEPHPHVYGVPVNGAPLPGPLASWDGVNAAFENTLDLESAGSLAPGLYR